MSSSEFVEWMAMSRIEPFGGPVDDYRAGLSAAATYNVNRSSDTPPINPLALFGWTEEEGPPPLDTPEQIEEKLRSFAAAEAKRRALNG